MHKPITEVLLKFEEDLLDSNKRKDQNFLSKVLHDDFKEISKSGRIYSKPEIIELLMNETDFIRNLRAINFEARILSNDVAIANYELPSDNSLRTSIWKNSNEHWQIIFHQGTIKA